jgi:hypothetical protein
LDRGVTQHREGWVARGVQSTGSGVQQPHSIGSWVVKQSTLSKRPEEMEYRVVPRCKQKTVRRRRSRSGGGG